MTLIEAYRRMLLIRHFEEEIERLFLEGRVMGTAHTCIGQEVLCVGVAAALQPQDAMTTTHRGHGHFLARGADPVRAMAELFGKSIGYSQGRGGSQMMMDTAIGFYGSNGITGASIPFATGIALDASLRKSDRVTACMFGDGASNQGVFHESLNIAALWKLPVLYIVENNGYAMSTATSQGLANPCVADRAQAYNMPGITVDGNDFEAVRQCVAQHAAAARAGAGPALIECLTYRLSGHSRGDPRVYRTREEEQAAWDKDPIRIFEKRLIADSILSTDGAELIQREVNAELEQAILTCEGAPEPTLTEYLTALY
ncbi:MAG: thiamine pyrophosphate-dependent dehydrogenase E1 component subunit alpha [Kiritimatiellae bacterium]|nr:thiamine pyrophosphate-dependent dehydrogenase E1 component subunit alpha [Kiritimatiellia bacterium]